MNLIINIFYNDGVFDGIIKLLRQFNISIWQWLEKIYENSTKKDFSEFEILLNDFLRESEGELWEEKNKLEDFCSKDENIKRFINGELGSNLIFKYKSRSLTLDLFNIAKIAKSSAEEVFEKNDISETNIILFLDNLINYKLCEVTNLFEIETKKEATFDFDIQTFLNSKDKDNQFNLNKYKFENKRQLLFTLTEDQTNQLKSYNDLFENPLKDK